MPPETGKLRASLRRRSQDRRKRIASSERKRKRNRGEWVDDGSTTPWTLTSKIAMAFLMRAKTTKTIQERSEHSRYVISHFVPFFNIYTSLYRLVADT
jgi:hypothetical protein